jgi:HK97 family phage portal protein
MPTIADRVAARSGRRPQSREAVQASPSRRADPVTMEEFGYLLGRGRGMSVRTKSGTTVGPRRALGITAWYSGVRFIAEGIAALPAKVYDRQTRLERADPAWLARPDDEFPWFSLVEFLVMAMLHKGNACAFKLRNGAGQVVGLREMHPDITTIGLAPDGSKRFRWGDIDREFTTRDVLHVPALSYDGRIGLNPIAYMADSLGLVAATEDYASRFFGNGTHVGGVISVPEMLTDVEREVMTAEWEAFHQGLEQAHRTGVLSKGATYNRISLNAAETQLLESRTFGIAEIARMLRIPPHKLYELSRATFSNIEHQSIEAVTDGLQPWCERIEAFVNFDPDLMPPQNYLEFELDGRLRGDVTSRYAAQTSSVGRPWRTPNEARAKENLRPLPGGDDLFVPLNMANPGGNPEVTG